MGIVVTTAAFALVAAAWLHYMVLIPREHVPKRPWVHTAVMVASIGAAVVGIGLWPGWVAGVLALFTVTLAGFFVWLLSVAAIPTPEPAFAVGDRLPSISARKPDGGAWSSEELSGRRTLLKIFRGHW